MGEVMNIKFILSTRMLSDKRLSSTAVIIYGILYDSAYPHTDGMHIWTDIRNSIILDLFGDNLSNRTLNHALALLEQCGYIKRTNLVRFDQQNVRIIELLGDNQ